MSMLNFKSQIPPNLQISNLKNIIFRFLNNRNLKFHYNLVFIIWCLVLGFSAIGCVAKETNGKPNISVWHWMTEIGRAHV